MFNRIVKIVMPDINIEISELKIAFNIEKHLVGYPNLATITIYNLSPYNRSLIEKQDTTIQVFAGYQDTGTSLIFEGHIVNIIHKKEQTDYISEIFAQDGAKILNTAMINKTFSAGTPFEQVYESLVSQMDGIHQGVTEGIKDCLGGKRSLLRELQLSGSVKDWLQKLSKDCGFEFSVNDGIIETQPVGLPLSDAPPIVINQHSGMIGSPQRTEIGVMVSNLLLPALKLGRTINLQAINTEINIGNLHFRSLRTITMTGIYRIDKINHLGNTHEDQWQTDISGRLF